MSYRLECVWKAAPEATRRDAVEFWLAEGALTERTHAIERAGRLLVTARDAHGRLAAVSTAYREALPQFGFSLFFLNLFVGRRHRRPGLARDIVLRAWRELNARFQAGESRDVLGLLLEVSSAKARRVLRDTVWRDHGMEFVYIGRNARGSHLRVWYFADSRIPI